MPALSFHSLLPGRPLGLWDGRTSLLHATQAPEAQEAQKAEEEDSEKHSHDCADHPEHRAGFCGHQRPRARLCSRRPCAVTWRMRRVQATQWKEAAPRAHTLPLMGPHVALEVPGEASAGACQAECPRVSQHVCGGPQFLLLWGSAPLVKVTFVALESLSEAQRTIKANTSSKVEGTRSVCRQPCLSLCH